MPARGQGGSLVALTTIDFKGNNITIDSFDSSNPDYSNWNTNWGYGTYTPGKRLDHALVATDGSIINVGNAQIYGYVDTAPGGTASINAYGTVGDTNWVNEGYSGIQPGHSRSDMNTIFPPANLPTNAASPLPDFPLGTNIQGTTYYYMIPPNTSGGTIYYTVPSLTGSKTSVYVNASNVVLTVNSNISLGNGGGQTITISTNSGFNNGLTLYVDGTINTSSSGSIYNQQQNATKVSIYGTTNCTYIALSGNGAGSSFIYAPSASLTISGGGNSTYDLVGAVVVHDISLNGHFNFHYDEALAAAHPIPPVIGLPSLQTQAAPVGTNVTFSFSPFSPLPMSFQWFFDQTNLLSLATNSSLSLTNVQLTDAGDYSIAATNAFGAATSFPISLFVYTNVAQLTPQLASPSVSTNGQFQFNIAGVTGLNYGVQVSTDLVSWVSITTNLSPFSFTDTNANLVPQRFYRSVYSP